MYIYDCVAESFLVWEEFQINLERKIHILCLVTFFSLENRTVYENVEKHGWVGQATDDNIIRRMHFACWITKATNTHNSC